MLYFLHFSHDKNFESRRKVVNYIAILVLKCHYLHICFALSAQPPTTMNFQKFFFLSFFSGGIFPVMKLWKRFILLLNAFNVVHSTVHWRRRKKVLTTTTKQMNVRRFQKNDFYDFKALFMKWTHFKSLSSTLHNLKDSKWDEMKRQESRKILEFHVRDTRRH